MKNTSEAVSLKKGTYIMDKKLIRISKEKVLNLTYDEVLNKYKGLLVKIINKWAFKYEFDGADKCTNCKYSFKDDE